MNYFQLKQHLQFFVNLLALLSFLKLCAICQTGIFKIDGCFGKDTPVLTWDGEILPIQDIELGMEVIGEEAEIRTVVDTFSGEDELYLIEQQAGINYTVNSKHRLLLRREIFNDKGHSSGFQIAEMTVDDFINEIQINKDLDRLCELVQFNPSEFNLTKTS